MVDFFDTENYPEMDNSKKNKKNKQINKNLNYKKNSASYVHNFNNNLNYNNLSPSQKYLLAEAEKEKQRLIEESKKQDQIRTQRFFASLCFLLGISFGIILTQTNILHYLFPSTFGLVQTTSKAKEVIGACTDDSLLTCLAGCVEKLNCFAKLKAEQMFIFINKSGNQSLNMLKEKYNTRSYIFSLGGVSMSNNHIIDSNLFYNNVLRNNKPEAPISTLEQQATWFSKPTTSAPRAVAPTAAASAIEDKAQVFDPNARANLKLPKIKSLEPLERMNRHPVRVHNTPDRVNNEETGSLTHGQLHGWNVVNTRAHAEQIYPQQEPIVREPEE